MAKDKWGAAVRRLARQRWLVQTGFLFAWLDPLMLRMHTVCSPVFHCYSCPLATFACPIGVLANFSAITSVPLRGRRHAGGPGRYVRQFHLRLGLPLRLSARPGPPHSDAEVHAACLDGHVSLRGAVGSSCWPSRIWFGEDSPLFICRLCPAGAIEAALPNIGQSAARANRSFGPPRRRRRSWWSFCVHALYLAAVVHPVLPAGSDLRAVQQVLGRFPAF